MFMVQIKKVNKYIFMSKLLVTHINPDPDAIASVWLFRRFDPQFNDASVAFVSAGKTYKNQVVDSDSDIVHVDTGMGRFDHHQTSERTCAAKIVLEYLQEKFDYLRNNIPLERLVEVILGGDHFDECYWPDPNNDRYVFMFGEMLNGLKRNNIVTDQGLIDLGSTCLDGILMSMKIKYDAEMELDKGIEFGTKWGKGLAIESKNDDVLPIAQKNGYLVVIRKDPDNGMVRIKGQPRSNVDFTQLYKQIIEIDPKSTWFLHASKKMLLNGSYKNSDSIFTKLSITKIISLLQK